MDSTITLKINYNLVTVIVFATVIFVGIVIIEHSDLNSLKAFAVSDKFFAKLSGNNEVPPIHSKATGFAKFEVMGDSIKFKVKSDNIKGATMGHIHLGKEGHFTKKFVAMLFMFKSPKNHVSESDMITAKMLAGHLKGKPLSALVSAMEHGDTYVNIHTKKHPFGEIRGQIMSK